MDRLIGKRILITGATSGIGEACAKLFAQEGGEVILVGRNKERGIRLEQEITSNGANAKFISCDISQEKNVKELRVEFDATYNRLDILFNNAGLLLTDPLESIREEEWRKVFAVNTDAVMFMTKSFIDLIIKAHGNILNNASIDGMQSNIRGRASYAYGASKAATIQFSQQCALNYSDRIRVNCLCPGITETAFFSNRDFSRFLPSIPMGRVAQPIEIAKAALFLISEDASYVSGAILAVDGAASIK